jgi:type IV pilus assembly protein PilM
MSIIGLDLGNTSFRALELDRKKDGIIVEKAHVYENQKLNFDSDSKEDIDAYANALKDFFSEAGFTTPYVSVGLDERYIYMRIIKLPQMSDKDLANAVNFEAEQYIPLPLSEVNVSFQRLDVDYADKAKINVQIVAARKSVLEKHIEVLKKARLVPKAIEPETLALGRALGDTVDNPAGSIVLDLGFSRTIVIISYGGYVRFTRNIPIGGDIMTRSLQQALNLDYNQAEEYKKTYGLDKTQADGKVFEIIKPHIDSIVGEIQRAGIFFTKQQPNASIKRVILTGGTAQMPGLLLYLASSLDFEVEAANPFKEIKFSPKILQQDPKFTERGPIFSAALGLGLKEV